MLAFFTVVSRLTSGGRLLTGGLLLGLMLTVAPAARAQTWMVSTTPYIKLGVLDKYGALSEYSATFVVIDEKGQEYSLVKQVPKGQNGVDVLFPTEPSDADYFKNAAGRAVQPAPGRYTWECRVNGKKAVSGHFNYPDAGNDITVLGKN